MKSCVGCGFSRWVGIGKFVTNSPASTCDLVKSCLYAVAESMFVVWSRTREVVKETRTTTLQTAYFQVACKATHTTGCGRTRSRPQTYLAPQPKQDAGIGD